MNQHQAPLGMVATLGHPANLCLIVKAEKFWRYVHNGEIVNIEDFRAGWDEYVPPSKLSMSKHLAPEEFEAHGDKWTVDLAPCDEKIRLHFGSVEGEIHYADAIRLSQALKDAVTASQTRWIGRK